MSNWAALTAFLEHGMLEAAVFGSGTDADTWLDRSPNQSLQATLPIWPTVAP